MDGAKRAQAAQQAPAPSPSEHIYIGSDDLNPDPKVAARTVRGRAELRNKLLRTSTELTLFEEGFLKVVPSSKGRPGETFHLALHYLDPVPTITRVVAKRWMSIALACTAVAGIGALLTLVEVLHAVATWVFWSGVAAAIGALVVVVYRSHEKTEFVTLHGRAPVLGFVGSLGSIKRFRGFVPLLSRAIEEAAEQIADDPSAFLRGEMREHYRLREDGVLSSESCAESTGRILAQFDIHI
jgi:hypothetical protein